MKPIEDIYFSTLDRIKATYYEPLLSQRALMGDRDINAIIRSGQYDWGLHWAIKEDVLRTALNFLYTDVSLEYEGISEVDFTAAYGFEYGDDYFSADCVNASYQGIYFDSVYVNFTVEDEEEYKDDEGKWHTEYYTRTIFRGEAIRFDVPFRYRTFLYLHPGNSRMDHPVFSDTYGVICDDPIYRHYVLTQDFMEQLVKLKHYLGIAPSISFYDHTIRILIPSAPKYPPIDFRRLDDAIWGYFFEAKLFAELLAILKLEEH